MSALLTIEEMYEADRLAIEGGVAGATLMENAGVAVCDEIVAAWPDIERVLIICGPGNNGGDGFVVARLLKAQGFDVVLGLLGKVEVLQGDAATMAARWDGKILPLEDCCINDADLVVDAIFGAGLTRKIEGKVAALIDEVNCANIPVVTIDLPSGIEGSSGQILGVAIKAELTVTFFRKKPGHLLVPGRDYCGAVQVADIGIPEHVLEHINPKYSENDPKLWRDDFPQLYRSVHKYRRGYTIVVSGSMSATGAARLAARGALRVGAGVVTIACPQDAVPIVAAHETAIMVRAISKDYGFSDIVGDKKVTSVLVGPGNGVGAATRSNVLAALGSQGAIVLDADALTSFESESRQLFEAIKNRRSNSVVMTPHEGEFSLLFKDVIGISAEIDSTSSSTRLENAIWASLVSGAVVVLKGPDTIIASPDGRAAINANAPPYLATAGSGDVLAGLIAGLLGQGMPTYEAAAAGVWMHGEAGALFGHGLIAEDLPEMMPEILQSLFTEIDAGSL